MKIKRDGSYHPYVEHECDDCTHAPTPWKVVDGVIVWETTEPLDAFIASVNPPWGNKRSPANAELIVRAVNSHHELLDALKTWNKFWETMPKGQMGKLSFDVGLFNEGFVKMRKALAKAEKKVVCK